MLTDNILALNLNEYQKDYRLVVYSTNGNAVLNNMQFSLLTSTSLAIPVNLDENSTVYFYQQNQTKILQFNIEETGLVELIPSQAGYSYQVFDENGNQIIQQLYWYGDNKAYFLEAGQYTVKITNTQAIANQSRQLNLNITQSKAIKYLAVDMPVTVSYSNSVPNTVLKLDLIAGQEYDLLSKYSYDYYPYDYYAYSSKLKYYLFNENGQLVYSLQGNRGANFKVDVEGSYYLVTSGQEYSSASGWAIRGYRNNITFSLESKETIQNYNIGEFISNTVNYVDNNQKIYRFDVAEKTHINLATLGYGLEFILKPTYSTTALWTVSAGSTYLNKTLTLDAGSYDLVIRNHFDYTNATRRFDFTITDLTQAVELPLDELVTTTLDLSAKTTVWKITGQAGQDWIIDPRTTASTTARNLVWYLYDNLGNQIASATQSSTSDTAVKVNLKKDGIYYLSLQGSDESQRQQARSTSIRVGTPQIIMQEIELNQSMSGVLSEAGEVHRYKLTLAQPQTVILDSLSGNVNYAYLKDVTGSQLSINLASNQYQVIYLPAGEHTFEFYSNRTALGSYQLRLLSLPDHYTVIDDIEPLTATLAVNQKMAIYAINVEIGKKYNIDFVDSNNLYYSIFNDSGSILLNTYNSSNGAPSFIANSQRLYVLVKRTDTSTIVKPITAQIYPVESRKTTLIFDQTVSDTLYTFDSTHSYQFNLENDGWLNLTDLQLNQSAMYLRLLGPNNTLLSQYNNLTTLQQAKVYLRAGQYRLEISSNNDNHSAYKFNAQYIVDDVISHQKRTTSNAQELFIDGIKTLTINQTAQQESYYRVMLNQDDQLFVRLVNSQITLLNKNGEQLQAFDNEGNFSIISTDVYYLKVSSQQALEQQEFYLERQNSKLTVTTDAGETLATAQEIFVPQGTLYTLETYIGDGANTNKDVDMYQLMLVAGDTLVINAYTSTNYNTRIFNASGQQVYSTRYGNTSNSYTYVVPSTGVYYIGLSAYNNNYNAINNTNLTAGSVGQNSIQIARRAGALSPVVNYTLPQVFPEAIVSESIFGGAINNSVNDQNLFYFEVKEPGLYYLDRMAVSYEYYHYGSTKVINIANNQQVLSSSNHLAYLDLGTYVVRGSLSSYSIGTAEFKWVNISEQKQNIELGQSITTTNTQTRQANNIYQFSVEQAGYIQFNSLASSGTVLRYKVYNQYGQLVSSTNQAGNIDSTPIYVDQAGEYYLIFDNNNYSESHETSIYSGQITFQIDWLGDQRINNIQSIFLNEINSGILTAENQSHYYELNLEKVSTLYLDHLNYTNNSGVTLQVVNQAGSTIGNYALNSYYAPITLAAGRYQLRIYTQEFTTKNYGFKLLDLTQVQQIESGKVVEDRLKPLGEKQVYQIEVKVGDRIFIDFEDLIIRTTGYYNNVWKYNYSTNLIVIDPYGRSQSISRSEAHNLGSEFVASVSGQYTILLDETDARDIELPYRMTVYVHAPSEPLVIDIYNNQRKVDLSISDLVVKVSQSQVIQSGSLLEVQWLVKNLGEQVTFGDFTDRVLIKRKDTGEILAQSLVPYSEYESGGLLPQQIAQRNAYIQLPEGILGTGEFEVVIDSDYYNAQKETVQAKLDNHLSTTFNSVLKDYANLVVENVALSPHENWQAGDTVLLNWQTKNIGSAAAQGSWVERVEVINLTDRKSVV